MTSERIKTNAIPYRSGYIEVMGGIHEGCINLECWDIHPDYDITNLELDSDDLPDEAIQGNTELELDLAATEALIKALQSAVAKVRGH